MNFCPNCGRRLVEKPVSTGVWAVLVLILVSTLLPPFGLGLTIRYLRSGNPTARIWGMASLILTVVVLVLAVWTTISISRNINQLVNQWGLL